MEQWRQIVAQYSKRNLTYSTDRLPALAGIASRFHPLLRSEYLAGIWLSDFPHCLAWYTCKPLPVLPESKYKSWPSSSNGVPSWSWASVPSQIFWPWTDVDMNVGLSQVELVSSGCRPSSENLFGEVEFGSYIELRGRVVKAEVYSDKYGCACVSRNGFRPQCVSQDCRIVFDATTSTRMPRRAIEGDEVDNDKSRTNKGNVYCLYLFTTIQKGIKSDRKSCPWVLILGKIAGSSDEYQRLGIGASTDDDNRPRWIYPKTKHWRLRTGWGDLEEWEDWECWFADAEIQTLKIL